MQRLNTTSQLKALRAEMQKRNLDAYILPMEDNHFSEYLAVADKRISFISGFTGSAGNAVITTTDKAALWTDGRYHNQASHELDENWTLMREGLPNVPTIPKWLSEVVPTPCQIGFDPNQFPFKTVTSMRRELGALDCGGCASNAQRLLVPVQGANLIDVVWTDRPPRPSNPIRSVSVADFAGISWEAKVDVLREQMRKHNTTTIPLTQLDEIAWLFNLRGSDISCNPVFFSFAVVTLEDIHVFADWQRRGDNSLDLQSYFQSPTHKVILYPYDEFASWLLENSAEFPKGGRVWLPAISSYRLVNAVPDELRIFGISLVATLKSRKNPQEIRGMRLANLVDSLALCDFLAWLDDVAEKGSMDPRGVLACDIDGLEPPAVLTEATVVQYLDGIRRAARGCLGLSFSTISGADANGAVIHYNVSDDASCLPVTSNSLLLVDSGGQYTTGTTDVTRTVHLGTPSNQQIHDYTEVLKAHVGLSSLPFPNKTAGTKLDAICRASMWRSQMDYAHGTGHGVGANLCVHEGPFGLSGRRSQAFADMAIAEPGLEAGMIVTIEPGYYLDGQYGIRLENVTLVVEAAGAEDATPQTAAAAAPFLAFSPLTLVPFQRRLIDPLALSPDQTHWVNAYHSRVRQELLARLTLEEGDQKGPARLRTRDWLIRSTEPL